MSLASSPAALLGVATGVPAHGATQECMSRFMANVLRATVPPENSERLLPSLRSMYENSGILTRYSAVADYAAASPDEFTFFPRNWQLAPFPSTAARMRLYERSSVDLAEPVARECIARAGLAPPDVTHLILCTCTGFFAPGPEIELLERLGLRSSTQRTLIGFMGCHAGINGLRAGGQIVLADPESRVLHICLELCSLHFQKNASRSALLSNCLFGDGCSAVIYGHAAKSRDALATCLASASSVAPSSSGQMAWRIGDTGFEMYLAAAVPDTLEAHARGFVESLLDRAHLRRADVVHWVIHPGGPRILEAVRAALELSEDDLIPAFETLRHYGNMSSPTIFFVLEQILQRRAERGPAVLLSFGPGLTMEGAVLMVGGENGGHGF